MRKVNLEQLMATTPESLAKLQMDELQKHALDVIDEVRAIIARGEYSRISEKDEMVVYSPAGDAHGTDSHFVNFGFREGDEIDVKEMCHALRELQQIVERGN